MKVTLCPVCGHVVDGPEGPYCTPISCATWTTVAKYNYVTREWDPPAHIDGQVEP